MNITNYERLLQINNEIKILELEKKTILDEVQSNMIENEVKTIKTDFGTFSIVERKTYRYSDDIKHRESEIKEMKKQEEENGKAESSISFSMRFVEKK